MITPAKSRVVLLMAIGLVYAIPSNADEGSTNRFGTGVESRRPAPIKQHIQIAAREARDREGGRSCDLDPADILRAHVGWIRTDAEFG